MFLLILIASLSARSVNTQYHITPALSVTMEVQTDLLTLERPADGTDHSRVEQVMSEFARQYAFEAQGGTKDPFRFLQRQFVDRNYVSALISYLPKHTFVGLSKRPRDAAGHQDMIDTLSAALAPLGFKPWVEPSE